MSGCGRKREILVVMRGKKLVFAFVVSGLIAASLVAAGLTYGKFTGVGSIESAFGLATFGFNAQPLADPNWDEVPVEVPAKGQFSYKDPGSNVAFKAAIESILFVYHNASSGDSGVHLYGTYTTGPKKNPKSGSFHAWFEDGDAWYGEDFILVECGDGIYGGYQNGNWIPQECINFTPPR
jgi:hypothetical protein